MKSRSPILWLLVAVVAVLAGWSATRPADALTSTKAYKEVVVTVVVTPSPTPVVFAPQRPRLVAAAAPIAFDVPPGAGAPAQVAQAQAQGSVPVQFTAKADPNYIYMHVVPGASMTLNAPYGTTQFTCVYQIYASYGHPWQVSDWGYGTNSTNSSVGFPIWNYSVTSNLAWLAEGVTTTFKPFYNAGGPGEVVFKNSSLSGGTQQTCIDLQVTVPDGQAPGTYNATIQYNLIVSG